MGELNTEKGADMVFEAGCKTFAPHQWLLVTRSAAFTDAKFFQPMKEGNAVAISAVHVKCIEVEVLKALLHFVGGLFAGEEQQGRQSFFYLNKGLTCQLDYTDTSTNRSIRIR